MGKVSDLIRDAERPMRAEHRRTLDKLRLRGMAARSVPIGDRLQLEPLDDVDALREIFVRAQPGDFYPLLKLTEWGDEKAPLPYRPVFHREVERHREFVRQANVATYVNLVSYRPSAISKSGRFTFKKSHARGVHGVFIDFDGGRSEGDEKWLEPGHLLTQNDIWEAVDELISAQLVPPFQMWANGTRGCYGIILLEEPQRNIEEAAELWRDVRGYFYRRLELLAADEGARAITQPLKAPGAAGGKVRYFRTGAPRTSFEELLEFFHSHPHETDPSPIATARLPFTVEQHDRIIAAQKQYDAIRGASTPRASTRRGPRSPKGKVAWLTARIDDWRVFIQKYRRVGYSRRQFFLDFASAVKLREFGLHGDSTRAYDAALSASLEVNRWLSSPIPEEKVRQQVRSAIPALNRSTEQIRLAMGITTQIAIELGLRTLIPNTLKAEREVEKLELRARRAVERQEKREKKRAIEDERRAARAERRAAGAATKKRKAEENENLRLERRDRDLKIAAMLREGRTTRQIRQATGAHRQTIARIRSKLETDRGPV